MESSICEELPSDESKTMECEREYYWVVLCKSRLYHLLQNKMTSHPILLGEADSVSPPPPLNGGFRVRCDDCGRERVYHSGDVLRFETEPPASFAAHPLFREL